MKITLTLTQPVHLAAANPSDGRPVLTAVLFDWRNGAYRATAANGFILASVPVLGDPKQGSKLGNALVPARLVELALKGRPKRLRYGEVRIDTDNNTATVRPPDGGELTEPLVTGAYPDYPKLVPIEQMMSEKPAGVVGFNPTFMNWGSRIMQGESGVVRFLMPKTPSSPIMLLGEGGAYAVIMPMFCQHYDTVLDVAGGIGLIEAEVYEKLKAAEQAAKVSAATAADLDKQLKALRAEQGNAA